MRVINVFFYLEKNCVVLAVVLLFVVSNIELTGATLAANPRVVRIWLLAGSLLIVLLVSLAWLDRKLKLPEYEAFMIQ